MLCSAPCTLNCTVHFTVHFTVHCLCRETYQKDKATSSAAAKLEEGEKVGGIKRMSVKTASYLVTSGEGIGKMVYR